VLSRTPTASVAIRGSGASGEQRFAIKRSVWRTASRFSCEPLRLRGTAEAPKCQRQTLPEVGWDELWLASCNRARWVWVRGQTQRP